VNIREALRLELVALGLVGGFVLGLVGGKTVNFLLTLAGAHLDYVTFLKGASLITIARIFIGNLMVALLLHFLPARFPRRRWLPALLIGAIGFVLGFFAVTSGITSAEFIKRLPHTVLEVFAYVIAARGGRLWPAIAALLAGAVSEWFFVLR
jgi:hypothetical protein